MYLCFEIEDKRMAFPEQSLVNMDDNGFTLKAMAPGRGGDMIFLKLTAFQGCMPDFAKALTWIKKKIKTVAPQELEFTNALGQSVGGSPAQPLPEAPSF